MEPSTTLTLVLFSLFILKHTVADFIFQTPWQALNKGTYGHPGGIIHALIHTGLTFFTLYGFALKFQQVMPLLALALLEGIIHYHIDWIKVNIIKKLDINAYSAPPDGEMYWFIVGIDQMAHYVTYVGMIIIMLLAITPL